MVDNTTSNGGFMNTVHGYESKAETNFEAHYKVYLGVGGGLLALVLIVIGVMRQKNKKLGKGGKWAVGLLAVLAVLLLIFGIIGVVKKPKANAPPSPSS